MILIISTNTKKNNIYNLLKSEFISPLTNILDNLNLKYTIIHYLNLDINKLNKYSKIIICGTALKDNDYLKDLKNFSWIKNYKKNLLGICAGAQIIGNFFDMEIISYREIGIYKPKILINDKIIKNTKLNEIYCLHNLALKENNKKNFQKIQIILETKIPQLIKIKNKEIYACLFHPEIKNKDLIENFLNLK